MSIEFPQIYMGIIIWLGVTLPIIYGLYKTTRVGYGGYIDDWKVPLGVLILIQLGTIAIILVTYVDFI